MLAKVILKREGITNVCTDTVPASYSEGLDLNEAADRCVLDSLHWEGKVA